MKKSISVLAIVTVLSATVFTACKKNVLNDLSTSDTRVYITERDSSVSYTAYKTFSINDSVAVINNGRSSKSLTSVDSAFITATVKYMQQLGYAMVAKSDSPNVGINITRIYNTSTGIISYGSYWDSYGGFYDPYYWGYGGYGYYVPYGYSVYQVAEGALTIDMLDLKNAVANNKINIIWTGMIRGEGIFDASTADSQVKALFDQSAYLKTN
jgi:hypothetical protein